MFSVRLFEPTGGAKISKKDICNVNIVSDSELLEKIAGIEKMLKLMQDDDNKTWGSLFHEAIIL